MYISQELSRTLKIANLVSIVFIIAIHYSNRTYIDISTGYNFNYFIQEFIANGIARVAVPCFTMLSGFFLACNVDNAQSYLHILKKKTRTLLLPYVLSSVLIFASSTILKFIFLPEELDGMDFNSAVLSILTNHTSFQLWFLRDLIILTILYPVILHSGKITGSILGLLFAFLWFLDIQPFPIVGDFYLINMETLFFFWLGGTLFRFKNILYDIISSKNTVKFYLTFVWFFLVIVRIYVDPDLDVWYTRNYTATSIILYKLSIFIGIIPLLQLSTFLKNNTFLLYCSGFTFFVYIFHVVPLSYFRIFTAKIIPDDFSYYINFPIALVAVFVMAHISYKYLGPMYTVFTGGRTPDKIGHRT